MVATEVVSVVDVAARAEAATPSARLVVLSLLVVLWELRFVVKHILDTVGYMEQRKHLTGLASSVRLASTIACRRTMNLGMTVKNWNFVMTKR